MKAGIYAIALLGWLLAAWQYTHPEPKTPPAERAQTSPHVDNIGKEDVHPEKVEAYKSKAKKTTKLPKDVQDDKNKHVLDSSQIPADDNDTTVTTVLDEKTGKVETYVKTEPKPWLASGNHGEVRLEYGIKNALQTVARASINEDLFQVKALHFGVSASIDTDGSFFIGAGVAYRW